MIAFPEPWWSLPVDFAMALVFANVMLRLISRGRISPFAALVLRCALFWRRYHIAWLRKRGALVDAGPRTLSQWHRISARNLMRLENDLLRAIVCYDTKSITQLTERRWYAVPLKIDVLVLTVVVGLRAAHDPGTGEVVARGAEVLVVRPEFSKRATYQQTKTALHQGIRRPFGDGPVGIGFGYADGKVHVRMAGDHVNGCVLQVFRDGVGRKWTFPYVESEWKLNYYPVEQIMQFPSFRDAVESPCDITAAEMPFARLSRDA